LLTLLAALAADFPSTLIANHAADEQRNDGEHDGERDAEQD
jgi:hypothetical protein